MKNLSSLRIPALLIGVALLSGCASSNGVHAVAPAGQDNIVGTAPASGEYTLYRATGYMQDYNKQIEPVWTVSASAGQKIGFRWFTDPAHRYDPHGGFHLVAFAGNESRDLGAIKERDIRYLWAGSQGDVTGYFTNMHVSKTINTFLLNY
jgi:hypothetical protein